MRTVNCRNVHVTVFALIILLQTIRCNEASTNITRSDDKCPLPLTVLDFIYNSSLPNVGDIWPCEVRYHWLAIKPFVKLVRFLLGYVTPLIIILGVTLNTVSFALLSIPVLCDSNLSIYLKAMALSDNGALIFNYAVGSGRSHSKFVNDIFMNSRFLCATNSVFMEFFQFTSTWLVVLLTWARVVAIISPFETRTTNHNRSTIISITALVCISFVISLTKLYSGGYETDSVFEFIPCQKKIKPWGSTMYLYIALSTWLPLLFIFIGNVVLSVHMKKTNKIHTKLTQNIRHMPNKASRTSRTLFAVSIVYLVLLLPLGAIETLELYWDVFLKKSPSHDGKQNAQYIHWLQEKMLLKWVRGFFFHVYHWNFAINFFLYYLTGRKFRNIVVQTLRNWKDTCLSSTFCKIMVLSDQSINSNVTRQSHAGNAMVAG